MDQKRSREQYAKRKKQLKRRRVFWTLLFIGLGAVLAFKVVTLAKDKLVSAPSITAEEPAETTVVVGSSEQTVEVNQSEQAGQTDQTDNSDQSQVSEITQASSAFTVKQVDAWQYILVNKANPIDATFAPPETFLVNGKYKADSRIKEATLAMFDAAKADGVTLTACSAYRAYDYQQKLFDRMKAKFSNLSDEAASIEAAKIVAKPGTSEHQTGLALDIVTPTYTNLNKGFADTKAGKWLKDNAYQYGFILRYPENKTDITQIIFEPWHYRYVGKEAAKIIYDEGLCYEEFVTRIQFEQSN